MSEAGKIWALQLNFCPNKKSFKKSAIVEFENIECVLLALSLNGKKFKGIPIIIQPIMQKDDLDVCNRYKKVALRVKNLPENITKSKLHGIFKPFGFCDVRFSRRETDSAEIIFDRLNNGLAALRESPDFMIDGQRLDVKLA